MDLQQMLNEADLRVPNAYTDANKVDWLNEINNEFYEIVKIPQIETFLTSENVKLYTLSGDIRAKNINKVLVSGSRYGNMAYERVNPHNNYFVFDDSTQDLTLNPAPSQSAIEGVVGYFKITPDTFLASDLTTVPQAPKEYHSIYVLGLCERIAKSMNDVTLANNYANDYQSQLGIAQQNYSKEVI